MNKTIPGFCTAVQFEPGAIRYDDYLFGWGVWVLDEDLHEEHREDMEELIEEMRAELYG